MRRSTAFFVPFSIVFSAGMVVWATTSGVFALPGDVPPDPEWMPFEAVGEPHPGVRLSGMAHYEVVVTQVTPGNLFREEKTHYLFPLFAPYDTDSRTIQVLVRTTRRPEPRVSYELMTVEGALVPSTAELVPWDVEIELGKRSDYYFADDMLLIEPTNLETGLDPRAKAEGR